MKEGFRPSAEEKEPQAVPFPENVHEAVAMHRETIEHEMVNDFGIPEIPKQILSEMEYLMKTIETKRKDTLFQDEVDESVYEQLQHLAIRIAHFKEEPTDIKVTSLPEEGYRVSFVNNEKQRVDRTLNEDEQDLMFQLEMWADQLNGVQNIDQFKKTLALLQDRSKRKPESEREVFVQEEMNKKYHAFGFTSEHVHNLITLSQSDAIPEVLPDQEAPGLEKMRIMREVWDQYLSPGEKSRYVKLAAAMTVAGAVEGIGPALLGLSMDSPTGKLAALFALGYIGAQVGSGWVRRHLSINFHKLLNEITESQGGLNEQLAQDLVFQPGERMIEGQSGRIISALERSQGAFRNVLWSVAHTAAPAIASTTAGIGLMLANDWRLGLISVASAPIAVAIARRSERRLEPIIQKTHDAQSDLAQEIHEQISAHQDIVLSGMRESMAERLQESEKEQNKLSHERKIAREDLQFQSNSLLNSAVMGGLTAGGVALRELGVQEAGTIVSALLYSRMFHHNFDQLLFTNNNLIESLSAIVEMEEVFNGFAQEEVETDKERVGASSLKDFSIDVRDVSLELGGKKIIDHVSFQVPAGGVVRLEGQSGHGKTTMTRLMSGYYQPTSGEVHIGDQEVDRIKKTGPDSLYRHMAYLSQHPYIFESGTVKDNLLFGNEGVDDGQMKQVLAELALEKRFTKDGVLDLSSQIQGLSGGERARLGLARVLLKIRSQKNGSIVFLDQPTEELDDKTANEVAQILLREKRKHPRTTLVIISHRNEFIETLEHPNDDQPGLSIQRVRFENGKITSS